MKQRRMSYRWFSALPLVAAACGAPRVDTAADTARPAGATRPAEATHSAPDAAAHQGAGRADGRADAPLEPFELLVPGTTRTLVMRPVPAGEVAIADPAAPGGTRTERVGALWFAACETTWDEYDAFVFAMDRGEGESDPPDAWTRPSKPYILMDRGYGHAGYPAISVSAKGAREYCRWLSARTGRTFRLPTEAEWEHAARAGFASVALPAELDAYAWHGGNSESEMRRTTHPVGTKRADAVGLHDVLGNAAEWAIGAEGKAVARGGSFLDAPETVNPAARRPDDRSLNRTDPQVPKSVWWLADGGFIGFRVVCEPSGDAARPSR